MKKQPAAPNPAHTGHICREAKEREVSQARCNARRRKQAVQNMNHLSPRERPNYKKRDAATSARHNAQVLATERRILQGSRKK